MTKLPTEYLHAAGRMLYRQHIEENGKPPNLDTAEHSLGQWDDGRYHLRVTFEDGHWWELPLGPEADAIIEAMTATRH